MNWSFAIVNGRLAEVFFDKRKDSLKNIFGHAYVREEEYETAEERKWIREDTARVRLSYRNKKYRRLDASRSPEV